MMPYTDRDTLRLDLLRVAQDRLSGLQPLDDIEHSVKSVYKKEISQCYIERLLEYIDYLTGQHGNQTKVAKIFGLTRSALTKCVNQKFLAAENVFFALTHARLNGYPIEFPSHLYIHLRGMLAAMRFLVQEIENSGRDSHVVNLDININTVYTINMLLEEGKWSADSGFHLPGAGKLLSEEKLGAFDGRESASLISINSNESEDLLYGWGSYYAFVEIIVM